MCRLLPLCQIGPFCRTSALGCSNQDDYQTDRLHMLRRVDLRSKRRSGGARFHENNAHAYTIDACVSKSLGSRCEADGRVSRRLIVHLSSYTHGFCVAPALLQHFSSARAIHGYCDNRACACLLGFSVA